MATRIKPSHNFPKEASASLPTKTIKRTSRKNRTRYFSPKGKIGLKEENKSIDSLKVSLREECLRLASFLKQETHRPGFVR